MFSLISRHVALHTTILLALVLLAGCAHTKFEDRYTPGAKEVSLWGSEFIPIDPEWRFVGVERVTVSGVIWNSSFPPVDDIETMLFVRDTEGGPAVLALSRVVKMGDIEVFMFLGGFKTTLGDRIYREEIFGLSSQTTDPEYRRYFAKLSAAGVRVAPEYRVRVLDRLPMDTILLRVMEFTPGQASSSLPDYGKLYPQERREMLNRPFR